MNVSYHELELILNPRIRQRTFQLPVRRGEWGELKRCPARKGGVYTLRANPEYERYRVEARSQPSQRAAVLWLVECCERHVLPAVVVTVRSVDLTGGVWLVGFVKGDQSGTLDRPRLLAARPGPSGDYTTMPALALPGAAEEIPEANQGKYAKAADNARKTGLSDHRQRLIDVVGALRLEASKLNAGNSISRRRLKSVEHQLRAYDREMRRSA